MASVQEIIQKLAAAKQKLADAAAEGHAAALAAEQARQLVAGAVGAGNRLVQQVQQLRDNCTEASERVPPAQARIDEVIADVRALGGDGGSGAGDPPPPTRLPPSATGSEDDVPEFVRAVAVRLPARMPGTKNTTGIAIDAKGQQVGRPRFLSGRDPSAAEGLTPRYRAPVVVTDHVEGHLAAEMRREGHRDVTLVVNRPPCPGPRGCDALLADLIPQGYRITVYVVDPDGTVRRWRRYDGNGKGVAR